MSGISDELKLLKEEELLEFVRRTVDQLNMLGDRLEDYITEVKRPEVGFEVQVSPQGEQHERDSGA
jgi:hypothetical protein